ncbi:MAG: ergothioneine biosynthesis protein EgtB [Polaromonas sp.]|nr:ergothioneine biosynthesis protein EgtB [Polaromonas sp.]
MRRAGKELLSLALMDARNHTLHLFAQYQKALESVQYVVPLLAAVNPPLWELGHIGWFQEWWIARNMQRALGPRCEPIHARLASIEPNADRWWDSTHVPHGTRWQLDLPAANDIRTYLLDTLEGTLDLLEKTDDSDDALYFYRLALFHEDMHAEAFVHMAQTLGLAFDKDIAQAFTPAPMTLREPLLIPACNWQLGSAGEGFSFDNERPQHSVQVPEFEIDAQPVTWSQYVEFVDDGGYDREELWSVDGWQWLQSLANDEGHYEGRRAPHYVDQIGVASGAVMQTRFGTARRMHGNQPAMHMTWFEADAWCRWAGRRLPFEVEWEVAAHTASKRGFLWGNVWEWTGTTFRGYSSETGGFKPDPYQEYSQPWFGNHKVLRGASFATRARMKSPKYRNFYLPERDDMFCGFRSCSIL